MKTFTITSEARLPRPIDEVFSFFADARNLEAITPQFLRFHVVTPEPIEMRVGAIIEYRLRVRGVPLRWRTRINAWEPPRRFVDEQIRGPYRLWLHEHTFVPDGDGTICRDRVEYAPPLAFLTHRLLVRPDVERIFEHRSRRLLELFPARPAAATVPA